MFKNAYGYVGLMFRSAALLALIRGFEIALTVVIMYLYGLDALAYPYVTIPIFLLIIMIMYASLKLVTLVVDINPLTAQRVMLIALLVDLIINTYLTYESMVVLGLSYIMLFYMLYFINIVTGIVLILLYIRL